MTKETELSYLLRHKATEQSQHDTWLREYDKRIKELRPDCREPKAEVVSELEAVQNNPWEDPEGDINAAVIELQEFCDILGATLIRVIAESKK